MHMPARCFFVFFLRSKVGIADKNTSPPATETPRAAIVSVNAPTQFGWLSKERRRSERPSGAWALERGRWGRGARDAGEARGVRAECVRARERRTRGRGRNWE